MVGLRIIGLVSLPEETSVFPARLLEPTPRKGRERTEQEPSI